MPQPIPTEKTGINPRQKVRLRLRMPKGSAHLNSSCLYVHRKESGEPLPNVASTSVPFSTSSSTYRVPFRINVIAELLLCVSFQVPVYNLEAAAACALSNTGCMMSKASYASLGASSNSPPSNTTTP